MIFLCKRQNSAEDSPLPKLSLTFMQRSVRLYQSAVSRYSCFLFDLIWPFPLAAHCMPLNLSGCLLRGQFKLLHQIDMNVAAERWLKWSRVLRLPSTPPPTSPRSFSLHSSGAPHQSLLISFSCAFNGVCYWLLTRFPLATSLPSMCVQCSLLIFRPPPSCGLLKPPSPSSSRPARAN